MLRAGIDLGGTKIEGVLLDGDREAARLRVATRREEGYDAILARIRDLYLDLARRAGGPHALGLGTPGSLSPETGLLRNSNTVCMNGRPLRRDLERLLGRGFAVENDANCFALAEARLGAARGKGMVFGVILGTGCGGGIVIDGKVWGGLQGIAGEWGHSVLDPAGPECYCGTRGCVETYLSGGGLERLWEAETGERLPLPDIVRRSRAGDAAAKGFMGVFFRRFGRALANLINVLDPDAVVLGGGVSNVEELYTEGAAEVRRRVFSDSPRTPILRHALGDSSGALGAALVGT